MNIGLILVLTGGLILTAGDIFMKEWVSKNHIWLFITGLIIYVLGDTFLALSFKYENIAVASMAFVIFNILTLLIISWIVFGESPTYLQIFGMLLGIASIIVLEV